MSQIADLLFQRTANAYDFNSVKFLILNGNFSVCEGTGIQHLRDRLLGFLKRRHSASQSSTGE